MTVKLDHQNTISTLQNNKPNEIEEAIFILEEETQRRKEDIRQRIEFTCASLRAQGNTQINKMLRAVRQLTVKEFCEVYGASTQKLLDQQKKNRLAGGANGTGKKRTSAIEIKKLDTSSIKRRKSSASDEEPAPKHHIEENQKTTLKKPNENIGPLFVHLNRQNYPKLSIRLDPEHSVKDLGHFTVDAPNEVLAKLDSNQKTRVRDQIQDLQNQLDSLKQSIL